MIIFDSVTLSLSLCFVLISLDSLVSIFDRFERKKEKEKREDGSESGPINSIPRQKFDSCQPIESGEEAGERQG